MRKSIMVGLSLLFCAGSVLAAPEGLVLRHPWPHAQSILQRLAEQYTADQGIPVTVVYQTDVEDATVPVEEEDSDTEADIIGLRSCCADVATIAGLARDGKAQDLSAWMDENWRSQFVPVALRPFVIQPGNPWSAPRGIYGIPISAYVQLFIYRTDLFARAGIRGDPEKWRWQEFLAAGRRLRRLGIEPLVGAFHQRGHPALSQMYEASHLGVSELLSTYQGSCAYTGPAWRRLFRIYTDLRSAGMCCTPLALGSREEGEAAFLEGRAAMLVDGPWFVRYQKARAPDLNTWRIFAPPWDQERARFMPAVPGGAGEGFIVNPRSERRRQALEFLRWLTSPEVQVTYANTTWMLPAVIPAIASRALHPRLQLFARHVATASPDLSYCENAEVSAAHYEGVLNILRGRVTPEEVLARIARVKAKGRAGKQ